MNLDKLVAKALAKIDAMSADDLKDELLKAGFEFVPDYIETGEVFSPFIEQNVSYKVSRTHISVNPQMYDGCIVSSNDECYSIEGMAA